MHRPDSDGLEMVLRILVKSGRALDFASIHKESRLRASSLTRQLRRGEKMGLIQKQLVKSSRCTAPTYSWKITEKGKVIRDLIAEA